MTEVRFYHLERQPLDRVLPQLLERSRERGWRVVVRAGSPERVEALSSHLWTYSEESFLAHGARQDGFGESQPIWLTDGDDRPNGAHVLFLVDGAPAGDLAGLVRVVFMIDGAGQAALAQARAEWKSARAAGLDVSYWQQDETGRWVDRAKA